MIKEVLDSTENEKKTCTQDFFSHHFFLDNILKRLKKFWIPLKMKKSFLAWQIEKLELLIPFSITSSNEIELKTL